MAEEFTAKFKVDISDLKKNISDANKSIKLADAEFKAATAGMDDWTKSADGIGAKLKALGTILSGQKSVLASYQEQLERQQNAYKENEARAAALRAKLQELADQGVSKSSEEYKKYQDALRQVEKEQQNNEKASDQLKLSILNQEAAVGKTEKEIRKYENAEKDLGDEADDAAKDVDDLGDATEEAGKDANSGSEGFTVLKGALASLAADAIKAAAKGLKDLAGKVKEAISEVTEYGDEIDKSSQKLGLSAETYQKLSYAMESSGADIESFKKGMINMNSALADMANGNEEAGATYEALGVSMRKADGSLKTSEELLMDTVDALASMEDTTKRDAAAQDIFGKSMTELRPLLNSGSEAIKELMQEAEDYGMVMSDEAVAASASYDDSLTRLNGTLTGLKARMVSEFLPSLTQVTEGFTKMIAGVDGGGEQLDAGIRSMISQFTSKVPEFLEVGKSILASIITGIQENAGDILQAVTGMIPQLFDAVASLIAEIDIGELITSVFECLNSVIRSIVPKLPELLTQLVTGVIEALPELFVGVGETIVNIFDGLFGGYDRFDEFYDKIQSQSDAWHNVTDALAGAEDKANESAGKWDEQWKLLQNITDESGNVKSGYEEMAKMLVDELNEELGTNIELIKGQIQDYDKLCDQIDKLIKKKRAELILQSEEEAYAEALKMRPQLVEAVADAEDNLTAAQQELIDAQAEYDKLANSGGDLTMAQQRVDNARISIGQMQDTLDEATKNLRENTSVQTKYMNDYAAVMQGDYNAVGQTEKKFTGSTKADLKAYVVDVKKQLEQDKSNYSSWLQNYKDTNSSYAKEQADYYARRIKVDENKLNAINELVESKGEEFDAAYVNGLLSKEEEVDKAGEQVGNASAEGIQTAQGADNSVPKGKGSAASSAYAKGLTGEISAVTDAGTGVGKASTSGIQNAQGRDNSVPRGVGSAASSAYASGISAGGDAAYNAGSGVASRGKSGVSSGYDGFVSAGEYAASGFAAGMGNKGYLVEDAAYSLAVGAKRKMERTLEVASPSKVMMRIGQFVAQGLAEGIDSDARLAIASAARLAQGVKDSLDGVSGADIRATLSGSYSGADAAIMGNLASATSNINNSRTNTFTQIINAPKQPSRLELYRQTQNLLQLAGRA